MMKKLRWLGFALASAAVANYSHAVENEVIMDFAGQPNNLPLYTSASGLGTMSVSPAGGGGFSVPAGHTAFVTSPGSGITTVFTPSSTAVPTRIAFYDQRASTYRDISAKCLNPSTQVIEPCDLSNVASFPRTNNPTGAAPYTQVPAYTWFAAPTSILRATTPGAANQNIQSNGGYITLPPYVREITVTAYGSGNADFSGTDIYMADAPSVSKAFAPSAVTPGGQTTLTITIKNPGLGAPIPAVNISDALPAPLKLVSASHTCTGGTLTATAGSSSLTLTGATLPVAGCQISAAVEWPGDATGISACTATPTVTNRITPPAQFSTAAGQLNTEALADLSCSYTPPPPVVSLVCTPTELFDSTNQQSVCTITSNTAAGASGLNVNLSLPPSNPRYASTCPALITIAGGQTSTTCTITATANTVVGDGDVVATLSIAPPSNVTDYTVTGAPAQVTVKDDDKASPQDAAPVPSLNSLATMLLSLIFAALGWAALQRKRGN